MSTKLPFHLHDRNIMALKSLFQTLGVSFYGESYLTCYSLFNSD